MDIKIVRRALLEVAGDDSPEKPPAATQALAVALLYIADEIEAMQDALGRLVAAASQKKPAKPAARRKSRRVQRKKR